MPEMFTRRFICANGILAAALTLSSPGAAQDKIALRVTAAPSMIADVYKSIATAFEQTHANIKVEIDATQRDYKALLEATLRDSLTGQLADASIQGNYTVRLYAERGMAVPLEKYLKEDAASGTNTLSPSVASIGRLADKTYGLGLSVSAPVIFFNLDLVKKAGIDAAHLPTTWDGILDLARKLNDPASGTLGGYFNYDQMDWFWIALVESYGGRMATADDKKAGFGGPEGLQSMQLLKAFGETGQGKLDMPSDQVRQLFAAGKLGIIADSSSALNGLEKQAGGRFSIATRAFPLSSPNAHLPAGGALGLVFAKDQARQRAAWEFLKFAAGKEGQTMIGQQTSYMVANSRVATDPSMLGNYFANKPNMKAVVDALPIIDGWYAYPGQNGGKIHNVLINHMRSVVTLKEKPDTALALMTREVQDLLPH